MNNFRSRQDLLGLPRNHRTNISRTVSEDHPPTVPSPQTPPRSAIDYLKRRLWPWIATYIKARFGRKVRFRTYSNENTGLIPLASDDAADDVRGIRVSLAGDWGTGTRDAAAVGHAIAQTNPDFAIHLGDVYYVGSEQQMSDNMLGGRTCFPRGRCRTFALNSNHEMYARGKGYFNVLLPSFEQDASFFALTNEHWIIIGLDTGYRSVGRIPVLEKVRVCGLGPATDQPKPVLKWLRDVVSLHEDDRRGVICLSHHQYYSAFERSYTKTGKQLAKLIQRPVLWFWGHEHRLAFYGLTAEKRGVAALGRCVGHGGMPLEDIEEQPSKKHKATLVAYDARASESKVGGVDVGFNGFANLIFRGRELEIRYYDVHSVAETEAGCTGTRRLLVTERFSVDAGGQLMGMGVSPNTPTESWLQPNKEWVEMQQ